MIIGGDREPVIENIKAAEAAGEFYRKVELGDPDPSRERRRELVQTYCARRNGARYRLCAAAARASTALLTSALNRDTELVGLEKLAGICGGAFITSNHFSPFENTAVRLLTRALRGRLYIVTQVANLEMPGFLGFLMNYADTVPISDDPHYLEGDFLNILGEIMEKREYVLIYPEQEMWFRYRKPRPPKRGAYYFASRLSVPVISCFVEQVDLGMPDSRPDFNRVRLRLHVLDVLTPDASKSVRENSMALSALDYRLKSEAYERVYGRPLSYQFSPDDIAGWHCDRHET